MNLTIYTDGGSLNNPGQAAYGFLIYEGQKLLHKQNKRIGVASNNVAEYTSLIKALEYIRDNLKSDIKSIQVFADSLLMVNQVKGLYKVKNADMKPLHAHVKMLEMEIGIVIKYTHVLRDKNADADALVKEALGK
jgi:ribonuclease HI